MGHAVSLYCVSMKSFLAVAFAASASAALVLHAAGGLTIDQLIDIRHPSTPMWSPDGRHVVFVWERAGVASIYVADAAISAAVTTSPRPRELAGAGGSLNGAFWSADGRALMIPRTRRSLARADRRQPGVGRVDDADGGDEHRRVPGWHARRVRSEGATSSSEALADGRETAVAREDRNVGGLGWSPDGASLVFTAGAHTIRHEQTPAVFRHEDHLHDQRERPGTHLRRAVDRRHARRSRRRRGGFGGAAGSTRAHFLVDRTSPISSGGRRRWSISPAATAKTLNEDVEEKFWSITGDAGANAQPSPDGKWIAFVSARDGWDHIYVMPAAGGAAVQITKGKFEAWRPTWSPDSTRIAFDANAARQLRHATLYIAAIGTDPARATITPITSGRGTNIAPAWSPDGTRLVYQHTDPQNSADLYRRRGEARRDAGAADRLDARVDGSSRRSSSRKWCTMPAPTASRCRRGYSCRRTWIARRNIRRSSGFTATASIRATTAGTCRGTTPSTTAFTSTSCRRATSSSRRTIAAASATARRGARASTWTSAAKTRRTPGWPRTI